jgi:hypothetical protein
MFGCCHLANLTSLMQQLQVISLMRQVRELQRLYTMGGASPRPEEATNHTLCVRLLAYSLIGCDAGQQAQIQNQQSLQETLAAHYRWYCIESGATNINRNQPLTISGRRAAGARAALLLVLLLGLHCAVKYVAVAFLYTLHSRRSLSQHLTVGFSTGIPSRFLVSAAHLAGLKSVASGRQLLKLSPFLPSFVKPQVAI